ncbi:unnamed protein product [Alternaria burnsii]|nr:unnamed protein product [Alternaria burnsii]
MKLHFAISCLAISTTTQAASYWCKCTGGSDVDIAGITYSCCSNGVSIPNKGTLTGQFFNKHKDCVVDAGSPLDVTSNSFANCCRGDSRAKLNGAQCNPN